MLETNDNDDSKDTEEISAPVIKNNIMEAKWSDIVSVHIFTYLTTMDIIRSIRPINNVWYKLLKSSATWHAIGRIDVDDDHHESHGSGWRLMKWLPKLIPFRGARIHSIDLPNDIPSVSAGSFLTTHFHALHRLRVDCSNSSFVLPEALTELTHIDIIYPRVALMRPLPLSLQQLIWAHPIGNSMPPSLTTLKSLNHLHLGGDCGQFDIPLSHPNIASSLRVLVLDLPTNWYSPGGTARLEPRLDVVEHVAIMTYWSGPVNRHAWTILRWFGKRLLSLRVDLTLIRHMNTSLPLDCWPLLRRLHLNFETYRGKPELNNWNTYIRPSCTRIEQLSLEPAAEKDLNPMLAMVHEWSTVPNVINLWLPEIYQANDKVTTTKVTVACFANDVPRTGLMCPPDVTLHYVTPVVKLNELPSWRVMSTQRLHVSDVMLALMKHHGCYIQHVIRSSPWSHSLEANEYLLNGICYSLPFQCGVGPTCVGIVATIIDHQSLSPHQCPYSTEYDKGQCVCRTSFE
jgi:hypothetical protein